MGLDTETGEYEAGNNNPTCHVALFNSETPKYVEARIEGITKCPGVIGTPPNGTYLLTQDPGDPKAWRFQIGNVFFAWLLYPAYSFFFVVQIQVFIYPWFSHQLFLLCQTSFTNQNICGVGRAIGKNGTAKIFWGPAIHP